MTSVGLSAQRDRVALRFGLCRADLNQIPNLYDFATYRDLAPDLASLRLFGNGNILGMS